MSNMKLVAFNDGSFGVRVGNDPKRYKFVDLVSPAHKWDAESSYFGDCKGKRSKAESIMHDLDPVIQAMRKAERIAVGIEGSEHRVVGEKKPTPPPNRRERATVFSERRGEPTPPPSRSDGSMWGTGLEAPPKKPPNPKVEKIKAEAKKQAKSFSLHALEAMNIIKKKEKPDEPPATT